MDAFRAIISGWGDAATNMATDEALFLTYRGGISIPLLRLYGWKPAACSIGCFQHPKEVLNLEACSQKGVSFVRRPTGGGVIFHDDEITYSLVLAQSDIGLARAVKESFEKITSFLIAAYETLGMEVCFAKEKMQKPHENSRVAFCFSGNEEYDILIQGKKIGGNAQKRRKNIILQHGCVPFSFDKNKVRPLLKDPETLEKLYITSLNQITGCRQGNYESFQETLISAFSRHFKAQPQRSDLTEEEKNLRDDLIAKKYSQSCWNMDRESR